MKLAAVLASDFQTKLARPNRYCHIASLSRRIRYQQKLASAQLKEAESA
ncbi:MAG: hypothetical protein U0103_29755 [Candidatus Obscuribacterales bacterium]